MPVQMHHCMQCGAKLVSRYLASERRGIPYCEQCGDYRFPVFNAAVSMIVTDPQKEHVLLIRQYGRPAYILTAGYINRGEDAEHAAAREVKEELGLTAAEIRFNRSHFFEPSNTLMLNFTVTAADTDARPNEEVDDFRWFTPEEALAAIKPGSLAKAFLEGWLTGRYPWESEEKS